MGLLTSVHRGAWWVKVDVIGVLRSGLAATSPAIRSNDRDRQPARRPGWYFTIGLFNTT